MSIQTRVNFPVKKLISKKHTKTVDNKENSKSHSSSNELPRFVGGSRRKRFGLKAATTVDSPSKKAKIDLDNVSKSYLHTNDNTVFSSATRQLFNEDVSAHSVKQAFHTCMPSRLVGRNTEVSKISDFLHYHLDHKEPGSLYISGAPGTGKTSSLIHVINMIETKFQFVFINCMSLPNSSAVYKRIANELGCSIKLQSPKNVINALVKHITASNKMIILVLDEIDQLDSKGQEILYSLFEWPQLPQSSVILVGIANALDLTDRVLPRLHTFKCQPELLHFHPYTKDQIIAILQDRLSETKNNGIPIIKPLALQLCARKIAACTGDVRKALDVCRRAIEMVESKQRQHLILHPTSDDRCNPGSPRKCTSTTNMPVDLHQINAVLHEIYGSRIQSSNTTSNIKTVTLPLQQKLVLCTLLLMMKSCKPQDLNLGKLYEIYSRVCKKRQMGVVDQSEFLSLCSLVESRGFIEVKKHKEARMAKVCLKIDESETEHVLQDQGLLAAVLSDKSVIESKTKHI